MVTLEQESRSFIMELSQLIHTSCRNGGSPVRGYITYGKTPDITSEEENEIALETMNYHLRSDFAFNAEPSVIDATFPRKFAFFKLKSGRYCLAQSSYVGLDCDGNRYGNFFVHAFVYNDIAALNPMSYAGSNQFERRLEKAAMEGPIAGTLPKKNLIEEPQVPHQFSIPLGDAFKKLVIFLRNQTFGQNDIIVVRVPRKDMRPLLKLLADNVYNKQDCISFMTYRQSSTEVHRNVQLYFDDQNTDFPMGQYHVYKFDLVANTASVEVPMNAFDKIWLDLLVSDERKALAFENSMEDIADKYHIDDLNDALTVQAILDQDYERIGGARNAVNAYSKYLAQHHVSQVANQIFNALSDADKANYQLIGSLYPDLEPRLRSIIVAKYIKDTVEHDSNYSSIVSKLVNPPVASESEIATEVFQNHLDQAFVSEAAKIALFDFAKSRSSENYLVGVLQSFNGDLLVIFDIYKRDLVHKHYTNLASILYDKLVNVLRETEDFKVLYEDVDQSRKDKIVQSYFSNVLSHHYPIIEARAKFVDENPFIQPARALDIIRNQYMTNLCGGSDYDKMLALSFADYLHFQRSQIDGIFNSLSRKDSSIEDEIFDLVDHLPTSGPQILGSYLSAAIHSYNTSDKALALLERINQYGDLQGQILAYLYEHHVLSLEETLMFVSEHTNIRGEKISLFKTIQEKRSNPKSLQEMAQTNPSPILKDYMDHLFEKDLSAKLSKVNDPREALKMVKEYQIDQKTTQTLLGALFNSSTPVDELAKIMSPKDYDDVRKLAESHHVSMPSKSGEILVYWALEQSSRGDMNALKALGFPGKSIYTFPVSDSFVKAVYRFVRSTIHQSRDQAEMIHILLNPLASGTAIEELLPQDRSEADMKAAYEYIQRYENDFRLVDLLKKQIKYSVHHAGNKEEKVAYAKRLGMTTDEEINSYASSSKLALFGIVFGVIILIAVLIIVIVAK